MPSFCRVWDPALARSAVSFCLGRGRLTSDVWGCSTGKSFRFVSFRACVRGAGHAVRASFLLLGRVMVPLCFTGFLKFYVLFDGTGWGFKVVAIRFALVAKVLKLSSPAPPILLSSFSWAYRYISRFLASGTWGHTEKTVSHARPWLWATSHQK